MRKDLQRQDMSGERWSSEKLMATELRTKWVDLNGKLNVIFLGAQSEICGTLELLVQMKKLGYQADSGFVLHDVEEEEKGQILLYHSEKIAIAFGILNTNPSKPILVTKNLRCVDCHTAWQKFFLCHLLPEPAMAKACKSQEEIASEATKHDLKALKKRHLLEEAAHAPVVLALSRPIVS
ncbi:hypothetical protein JHK84_050131 [Glycine max]|nr:hypothetical protein JHK86_050073 [Glycine max]KAG5094543.1 hypothetical protein JHK84_050131 [Glycine max]